MNTLLETYPYLPTETTVLGICQDGLPVLFDFHDQSPGSILISGDQGCGKTHLLKSISEAAIQYNTSWQVNLVVITSKPEDWDGLRQSSDWTDYCLGFEPSYERRAEELVSRIARMVEERRFARQHGPTILLIIDNLEKLVNWDSESRDHLEWILKKGPSYRIFPICSIQTEDGLGMGSLLSRFKTRIIGKMNSPSSRKFLAAGDTGADDALETDQFMVMLDHAWITFKVPMFIR